MNEKVYVVKTETCYHDGDFSTMLQICTTKEVCLKRFKQQIERIKNNINVTLWDVKPDAWEDEGIEVEESEEQWFATDYCGTWATITMEEHPLYNE